MTRILRIIPVLFIILLTECLPGAPNKTAHASTNTNPKIRSTKATYQVLFSKRKPSIDKKLISLITNAKTQIYAALQEINDPNITNALIKAFNRGVEVKIVIDNKYLKRKDIKRLRANNIPIKDDKKSALMHNKFIVFDKEWVLTGSLNTTSNGLYKNNNNLILIRSKKLALNFLLEFNEMFFDNKFGKSSPSNIAHPLVTLDDKTMIRSLFGPEDKPDKAIIKEIQKATKSIVFYAFSFTHKEMGALIIKKFLKGLRVSGIFEKRVISRYSMYKSMIKIGMDVRKDKNKYFMHHKVMIIDGVTTITGSFNFSKNASNSNDENILIIKSAHIASLYLREFKRLF